MYVLNNTQATTLGAYVTAAINSHPISRTNILYFLTEINQYLLINLNQEFTSAFKITDE